MMTLRLEMEEKFEIAVEWHGSVLCVVLAGRLDAKTCDRFTQETDVAISEARLLSDAVILDCSALEYTSGSGWHRVLCLAAKLRSRGVLLLIAELPAELYDVLSKVDFLGLIKIYRTMSDAHRSLT